MADEPVLSKPDAAFILATTLTTLALVY